MSKDEILLSPKYGVNPTIPVCFWCGKPKNEIALLGRIGDAKKGEDVEAPKNMVLNYEPCEECQKNMALGTTVIEVTEEPNSVTNLEIQKGAYPTSRWSVITKETSERIFGEQHEKVLLSSKFYEQIFQTDE
jgi:hypothetical protein